MLFRPRVRGLEHIPADGFVLCANQLSNLDGFALAYPLYPRQLRWMGKAELFRWGVAPLLRTLGIFPVRRGTGDVAAIETAVALARGGDAIGIFPEGTRRTKGFRKTRAPRPHSGAARVALAAGVPLVPAAIRGTERLTLLRRWRLAVGAPVPLDDLSPHSRADTREATQRLWEAISRLEGELDAEQSPAPRRLRPRLLLDLSLRDVAFALAASVFARRRGREMRVLARTGSGDGLVCFSVRSAFDLLLQALDIRTGDEIVVSAITHPDMVRIIEAHGARAVPVDLELESLAPCIDILERAITDSTRAVLVAHLFGSRLRLDDVAAVARARQLLLIEDCAQSLRDRSVTGDVLADASLFSFGSIKTSTALGGAIARVRDVDLLERMKTLQAAWPVQRRRTYAARAARFAALLLLSRPRTYWLFSRTLAVFRRDLDAVVNGSVRGFPGDLLPAIRRRPSAPLLALLERRLAKFDRARLERRAAAGEELARALGGTVVHPGCAAEDHTHWVFPIVAPDRASLIATLARAGFDAATATSAIGVVEAPPERNDLVPRTATKLLAGIVFLPAYPELGADEIARLAAAVKRARDENT